MEAIPDFSTLSDEDLKRKIYELEEKERRASFERRILHGQIDILRAELQSRLKQAGPKGILAQVDMDRLSEILAGKAAPPADEGTR